jgi:uncharacterized protein YyaL (SSP411 family)
MDDIVEVLPMRKPNRLIHEKSPYLLQHAYNPVDWYPWSEEAFEKAKRENKPIFLSIGYSTCHWCHVMEKESFEDEQVAKILNEHYVAIKVDREERPDIDHIYMMVCQALTGHGGWPLTVFLTPDRKPFFAGTYFPKEDRYGRTGLVNLLNRIAMMWKEESARAEQMGQRILDQIQVFFDPTSDGEISQETIDYAFEQFARQYDEIYGGFGDAPKFPRAHDLLFLLRYYKRTGEREALEMVTHTLRQMRKGGIYDHLGFGFARYSVDREWLVPHFEKMLYDNALLALAYTEAYQVTKEKEFAKTAREIFTYILRDMTHPEGGFYSAEDADSEGEEGKFYVWRPEEIRKILGEKDGELFCLCYDVTENGNFENGTSILNQIQVSLEQIAQERGLGLEQLKEKLEKLREKLFQEREKRVHPLKDDKVITSWNGLMIAALAYAGRVLGETEYLDAAVRAVKFIRSSLCREDGRLLVRYRDGEGKYLGYLDDYAYFIWGLIELYQATFEPVYIELAMKLSKDMIFLFKDQHTGGFFFYGHDAETLVARPKEVYDGAMPSGNSVVAYNLIRLAKLTADPFWEKEAHQQIQAFAGTVAENPISYSFFLVSMMLALGPTKEIVIAGNPTHGETKEMIRAVQRAYLPEAVLALQPHGEDPNSMRLWLPMVDGKPPVHEQEAKVYICENYACQLPIGTVEELNKRIEEMEKKW